MHRIDGPTAAPALPAPGPVVGTPGYYTDGDPDTVTPPTTMTPAWANAVQEELLAVITHAGLAPDKSDNAQLLAAILELFGAAGVTQDIQNGEFTFYGGGLCKVGIQSGAYGEGQVSVSFRTPFPTACLNVQLTEINTSGGIHTDFSMQVVSVSKTGFTAMVQLNGSDGTTISGFHWDAKGY